MAIFDFEVLVIGVYLFAVVCWAIQKALPRRQDFESHKRN